MSKIDINHKICRIRQPTENSCWATAFAMQIEAGGGKCYSVHGLINYAKSSGIKLNDNDSLPINDLSNLRKLGRILGLEILVANGDVQIRHLLPFLRRSPVTLLGQFRHIGQKTPVNHAVVVGGIWGDGAPQETAISIVDPYDTQPGSKPKGSVSIDNS